MSTARCLSRAFEACRPCKTLRPAVYQSVPRRFYANSNDTSNKGKEGNSVASSTTPGSTQSQHRPAGAAASSAAPHQVSTDLGKPEGEEVHNSNEVDRQLQPKEADSETLEAQKNAAEAKKEFRPILPNVVAALSHPLKHKPTYGVPVASLQLRSYSVRSLEFFADFALRAAYYLNLPARGPVPLPKRIERWTTIRDTFVHKKSQENFERITYKRNITIMDGEKSAVEVWLAVLRKWQFFGVGMKANVWEFEGLDVSTKMDKQAKDLEKDVEAALANFGWNQSVSEKRSLKDIMAKQGTKQVGVPMSDIREASQTRESAI